MRSSFGSLAFRYFDKVIVVVLAVVALLFVFSALVRDSENVVGDPSVVRGYQDEITRKQENARHTPTTLEQDYLTATFDGVRPTAEAALVKPGVMGDGEQTIVPPVGLAWTLRRDEPPTDLRDVGAQFNDAEIVVADPNVVSVRRNDQGTLEFEALVRANATTRVDLTREGVVVLSITVNVTAEIVPEAMAGRPVAPRVAAAQGQAELSWGLAPVELCTTKEYGVFRGEAEDSLELYLRVLMPEELVEDEPLKTVWPDGTAGPDAFEEAGRIRVADRRVQGGVTYWYAFENVAEKSQDSERIVSSHTAPVSVSVEEAFRITFRTLAPDHIALTIEIFHVPADGAEGQWVKYTFTESVGRGQAVGRLVPVVPLAGGKLLKNVDFYTGYIVLDILNAERRLRQGAGAGDRQVEETPQKVLLINERGRIKVLWPSIPGTE